MWDLGTPSDRGEKKGKKGGLKGGNRNHLKGPHKVNNWTRMY